jgi:putative mRNA 3-end processing factor
LEPPLQLTESGLYCPAGDFYINPTRPVPQSILTHAQAAPATGNCLTAAPGAGLVRELVGYAATIQAVPYGNPVTLGGVRVSLHPAGYLLGSAQVRVEHPSGVAVVASEFKLAPDPTCSPFEPLRCDLFVTGATFALPIFRWPPANSTIEAIQSWWRANQEIGKTSVLFAERVGDAQRLLATLQVPVEVSPEIERINDVYRAQNICLPNTPGGLKLLPLGASLERSSKIATAHASGWMRIRGPRRRQSLDRGFVLSNHADWDDTLRAIDETRAESVWVTHGYRAPLVRWLEEHGRQARAVEA